MADPGLRHDKEQVKEQKNQHEDKSNTMQSLEKALILLRASDDTSRFVGLALLKSMLDNHTELRENPETITKCWRSIPASFLDRLIKARPSEKRSEEEARNMIGLAVAVMHAFLTLLPQEALDHESFKTRLHKLSAAEPYSSRETASQISQISLAICFPSLRFAHLLQSSQFEDPRSSPYLFMKMLLVDIRSTLPSLQEKLNSPDYPSISSRIAESYDVISNFIGYLVQSLDEEGITSGHQPLSFEPSQLLQLRTDISETMSLTIEHLRDRYDASVSGAAGLHPSARTDLDPTSSTPRSIAWESSSTSMSEDPLTLSETRTLALWLREDDNDALRREAAGIVDVVLGLYSSADARGHIGSAVLTAFEGIFEVPEGIDAFLREDGWETLSEDLQQTLSSRTPEEQNRGLEIVRALLTVAESEVVGPAKQEWVKTVDMAIEALQGQSHPSPRSLDLPIAVCQLAVEVLTKLPKGTRKRQAAKASKLSRIARSKVESSDAEATESLWEVIGGIEEMNI